MFKIVREVLTKKMENNCYGKTKENNKIKGSENERIKQPKQK